MKKYLIIQIDDSGDLNEFTYDTQEEAAEHLEKYEWKAYLIAINGEFEIEDHT